MNNYNNPNRRNNNQRRNNSRGGSGKPNGRSGGGNRPRNYDDENISPQQKRHFVNKRDTHLARGKEMRANGDRIEAENEFQHAEHYTRMIKIADEQQEKFNARKAAERPEGGNNNQQNDGGNEAGSDENFEDKDEPNSGNESTEQKPKFTKKRLVRAKPMKADKPENNAAETAKEAEPKSAEIAELPFMQPIEKPAKKAE